MKRNPRKVRWTKAFRKAAGKEMTIVSLMKYVLAFSAIPMRHPGLDDRVREEEERAGPLQPRAGTDDGEGDEEDSGDQAEAGACLLEEQVRCPINIAFRVVSHGCRRMAVAREKLKTHRKRKLEKTSVKLLQPITPEAEKVKEKIKIATKTRSALVAGEGMSMGMDID